MPAPRPEGHQEPRRIFGGSNMGRWKVRPQRGVLPASLPLTLSAGLGGEGAPRVLPPWLGPRALLRGSSPEGRRGLLGRTARGRVTRERRRQTWEGPRAGAQPPVHPQSTACSGCCTAGPVGAPRAVHAGDTVAVRPGVALSRMSGTPRQQEVPGGAPGTWRPEAPSSKLNLTTV